MQSSKLVSVSKFKVFFRKLPNDFGWMCSTIRSCEETVFVPPGTVSVLRVFSLHKVYLCLKSALTDHCLRSILSVSKIHLGAIPLSEFHGTLFIRRFSSEKSPSITVTSFFPFFFVRPQTQSCIYHFLQTSLVHMYLSVQSLFGLR